MTGYNICWDDQSSRDITINLELFPPLEGHPHEVNNKPRLSSNEEKYCVVLDSTRIDYEVDKMTKGYYRAIFQSIKLLCHFPLFSPCFKI